MLQTFIFISFIMAKVAVVTGSNKGIGFAIVETLCKNHPDWIVYLTARDTGRGNTAIEELKTKAKVNPKFHQLDIDCKESIQRLADFIKSEHGGLDVLVNNAAIAYKQASTAPLSEQAEVTVATNYTATNNVCEKLFPLLRPHARVVHVSSRAATMALKKCSSDLQKELTSETLTYSRLDELMNLFVVEAKLGNLKTSGWPEWCYGVSKIGLTARTFIQQRDFDKDSRKDIVVNSCCPGYVATDMSSHKGTKTIYEGADTPVYLATLPPNVSSPRGAFVAERNILPWAAE